jgi:hypothetical protein
VQSSAKEFSVWRRLLGGADAEILLLGGSASAGSGISTPSRNYGRVLVDDLNRRVAAAAPPASQPGRLSLRNLAQGSTRTPWATQIMLDEARDPSVGLVVWEYAMNDAYFCSEWSVLRRTVQTFLEKLGAMERPPALLLVFFWSCGTSRGNFRSRYFDELEALLEARSARQPLLALDAAGLVKALALDGASAECAAAASEECRQAGFVGNSTGRLVDIYKAADDCHPAEAGHALVAEALATALAPQIANATTAVSRGGGDDGGADSTSGDAGGEGGGDGDEDESAAATHRARAPSNRTLCACTGVNRACRWRESCAAMQERLERVQALPARSFLAWQPSPSGRVVCGADRDTAADAQPATTRRLASRARRPAQGSCAFRPRRDAALQLRGGQSELRASVMRHTWCDAGKRADCKYGVHIPSCAAGGLSFGLPPHTRVAGMHWKAASVGEMVVAADGQRVRAELVMEHDCARSIDRFFNNLPENRLLEHDPYWIPARPRRVSSVTLCARGDGNATAAEQRGWVGAEAALLYWLVVFVNTTAVKPRGRGGALIRYTP